MDAVNSFIEAQEGYKLLLLNVLVGLGDPVDLIWRGSWQRCRLHLVLDDDDALTGGWRWRCNPQNGGGWRAGGSTRFRVLGFKCDTLRYDQLLCSQDLMFVLSQASGDFLRM
jgi:hypothetical protein